MAFIETIPASTANGAVRDMYESNQASSGYVPNYVKVFSHRPDVMAAWGVLIGSIRANLDLRRYELVTLAAARALNSSYCLLAHGTILRDKFYAADTLAAIAADFAHAGLAPVDVAIMAYADHIVRDAASVRGEEIEALRGFGLTDAEIFDIAAATTARCFFSKLLDALGAEPDAAYAALEPELRARLTRGRAISGAADECVPPIEP